MNALLGFIGLFILAFLQINPNKEEEKSIETAGEYIVVVTWPNKSWDDIDTYVLDPAGNIVFFQSRESGLMHLERDDLGARSDYVTDEKGRLVLVEKNEERVIIRGVVTGEYIVNVHMYSKIDPYPTPVNITLIKLKGNDEYITQKEVILRYRGDEETAFRFTLNINGEVTNINYLPRRLVGGGK